ncbi:hypothetical protein [Acaryochloris marina]|uniref:hypothetical protein n=1 Tax=Acaryochloris marina TaxID=155978 RepID=UPI001BAE9339|nr:hypothetical protein [Acaryochloris marina]QUY46285.1 hypothetical protein I1H34_31790 [Acaryochloris marina S15]
MSKEQDIDARAAQVEAIMLKLEEVLDLDDPRQNRLHQCMDAIANQYIGGSIDKCWEVLQPLDQQIDIELLEHQLKLDQNQ